MIGYVEKVLLKVFSKGFFKEHAGFLLFLFGVILSHIFWLKPLGGHLTHEQSIFFHLIMLISFASDPIMTILFTLACIIYSVKSWNYINKQLHSPSNQFLYYSISSQSYFTQFKNWWVVQAVISLPIIIIGFAAIAVGTSYGYFLLPCSILVLLIILIFTGAFIHTHRINAIIWSKSSKYYLGNLYNGTKPLFSLFIFHIIDQLKLPYALTKLISLLTFFAFTFFFHDLKNDPRIAEITSLLLASGNGYLIYKHRKFEEDKLPFLRNLPISKVKVYLNVILLYIIILLPELLLIYQITNPSKALILAICCLGISLLNYSALYLIKTVKSYTRYLFLLFFACFMLIMFGYFRVLLLACYTIPYFIYANKFYNYEPYPTND